MKEYVLCICFSILFCAGVNLFVPSARYAGIINIVCGVYILHTMLSPVKGIIATEFKIDNPNSFFEVDSSFRGLISESSETMEEIFKESPINVMETQLKRELADMYGAQVELKTDEYGLAAYVTADDKYVESIRNYIEKSYSIKTVFE